MRQNHDVILLFKSLLYSFSAVTARHKNIGGKIEFRKINFRDETNFNNFVGIEFRNLGPKLRKQIPQIFFFPKVLPAKNSTNKAILKQERKADGVKS